MKETVLALYPVFWSLDRFIDEIPDLRGLKSEWGRNKAASWSPWQQIADDIDALSVSPQEDDRDLFQALVVHLEYPDHQNIGKIAFQYGRKTEWPDLYLAISYALLSHKEALPLLIYFAPSYMEAILAMHDDLFGLALDVINIVHPNQFLDVVWKGTDIKHVIRSYRAVKWYVDLSKRYKLGEMPSWMDNKEIARVLFDDGERREEIIATLAKIKDTRRLREYIETVTNPILFFKSIDSLILLRDTEIVLMALKKAFQLDSKNANPVFINAILQSSFSPSMVTVLSESLPEFAAIWKSALVTYGQALFENTLKNNNAELLFVYHKLGLQFNYEWVLGSVLGSNHLSDEVRDFVLDNLCPSPDPFSLLNKTVTQDAYYNTSSVLYILRRYKYTERQLYAAISRFTSPMKTQVILNHLGVPFDK